MYMKDAVGYYFLTDNGDGSVSVQFFQNKEKAEKAKEDYLKKYGDDFCDNDVQTLYLTDFK